MTAPPNGDPVDAEAPKPPNIAVEPEKLPKEKNSMVLFADQPIRVELSVEFPLQKIHNSNSNKPTDIGGMHKAFFASLLAVCGRNIMLYPTAKNRESGTSNIHSISKENEFPTTDRAHNKFFFERLFRKKTRHPPLCYTYTHSNHHTQRKQLRKQSLTSYTKTITA